MGNLQVNFAGLQLRNPVIMASAPPTETVESIKRCAEAGAAAAVTKTMADFDAPAFRPGARRAGKTDCGFWALSTFRRETLTLEAGTRLIADAVRETDIPIIASVGALDLEPASWRAACTAAENAGASMIQLDLFHLPQPRCAPPTVQRFLELLRVLASQIAIPVLPKLNLDLPPHFAAHMLRDAPIAGAILLDSIRTPPPFDVWHDGRPVTPCVDGAWECSLFGPWQKPLTLQYVTVLAMETNLPLMAGGGLMDGTDAAEAIMLGATTVQFATAVIRHGHKRISRIVEELQEILDRGNYATVADMRGRALRRMGRTEGQMHFHPARAVVDTSLCTGCGTCTDLVFCPALVRHVGAIQVLPECDGCGLCVSLCPTSGALTLQRAVGREP